jgi:hypothetical protein
VAVLVVRVDKLVEPLLNLLVPGRELGDRFLRLLLEPDQVRVVFQRCDDTL